MVENITSEFKLFEIKKILKGISLYGDEYLILFVETEKCMVVCKYHYVVTEEMAIKLVTKLKKGDKIYIKPSLLTDNETK